jgi:hypothetical protein
MTERRASGIVLMLSQPLVIWIKRYGGSHSLTGSTSSCIPITESFISWLCIQSIIGCTCNSQEADARISAQRRSWNSWAEFVDLGVVWHLRECAS